MTTGITSSQSWTILKSLAQKAGVEGNLSTQDVEKIMKTADTNNDGTITADEFTAAAKEKVDATEEQYLEAFKVISNIDGDDSSISDSDIEKAITDFLNGATTAEQAAEAANTDAANATDAAQNTGSNPTNTGNNTGATNNTNNATTDTQPSAAEMAATMSPTVEAVSLTGEEDLSTLQAGRSDTLSAIQEARAAKASLNSDPAVVAANEQVTTAKQAYNDSLTALEQKEGEKTKTEQAVLDHKALKDENDKAL